MATVKVNFDDLRDAAGKARKAAAEMESYADAIPRNVNNPLSSLTGGASNYTSTAASLATRKQRDLRQRASSYKSFARQVESFVDTAQSVDNQVKAHLSRVADQRTEGMNAWEKAAYYLYKAYNHTFGSTEAGAFVGNVVNVASYVHSKYVESVKRAFDWFAHGNGKYVLNIALSLAAVVGAIAAAILTFPVGTVLAAVVAAATIIASVVTVLDSAAKLIGNVKALSLGSTEPGQARYYGTISDLTDYAKKTTTNAGAQSLASAVDTTGKVMGMIAFVGGFGVTRAADGTNVTRLDKESLVKNIGNKFGFKFDVDENRYMFNPKEFMGFGKEPFMENNPAKWFRVTEGVNNFVTPIENVMKSIQNATSLNWNGKYDGYKDVKNVTSGLAGFMPGLKGYDKVLGFGHDIYGWVH